MAIEKTEAFIINSSDWSDTSRILSFYTRDRGGIKAVARGAKRKNSSFAGALGIFYLVDIVYYEKEGRHLHTLAQCAVKNDFPGIRRSLAKTAYCSYFAQAAEEICGGKEKSGAVFQLLLDIFGYLEENEPNGMLARFFEVNLLKAAGYGPVLKKCSSCGRELGAPAGRAGFSPGSGGAVCGECMGAGAYCTEISCGSLSTLTCLERADVRMQGRVRASEKVKCEIKEALACYLGYYLEKELKSREFLEEVVKDDR